MYGEIAASIDVYVRMHVCVCVRACACGYETASVGRVRLLAHERVSERAKEGGSEGEQRKAGVRMEGCLRACVLEERVGPADERVQRGADVRPLALQRRAKGQRRHVGHVHGACSRVRVLFG